MPSPKLAPEAPARADPCGALGLVLPTYPQRRDTLPTSSELAYACRRAEAAGAGALWACDHLFWHTPNLECLSAVSLAALATRRVTVGPCVLQLPLRNAPAVAKQASSLNHLSGGRLVLGVGVGARRGEYQAASAPFETRGARLDHAIQEMRSVWTGRGTAGYRQLPPAETLPVWIGGSSEAALRRAARVGDGWIPLFVSPSEYALSMARLDKEAERAGREPEAITRAIVVFVAVGDSEAREGALEWMASLYSLAPSAFRRHLVSGSAKQVARGLSRYRDAGASHVAVFVTSDDPLAPFEDLVGELDGIGAGG